MSKYRIQDIVNGEETEGNPSVLILTQEEYLGRPDIFEQVEGEKGFLRTEWTKVYEDPEYAGWMNTPEEPTNRFLLVQGSVVTAHAAVLEREVQIATIQMRMA